MEWLFDVSIEDMMLNMQENDPKAIDIFVKTEIKKIIEIFAYLLVNAIYLSSKENGRNVIASQDVLLGCKKMLDVLR